MLKVKNNEELLKGLGKRGWIEDKDVHLCSWSTSACEMWGQREKGRVAGWLTMFILPTKPRSGKYPAYQEQFYKADSLIT